MDNAGGAQGTGIGGASGSSTGQDCDCPMCSCGKFLFHLAQTAQGHSQP